MEMKFPWLEKTVAPPEQPEQHSERTETHQEISVSEYYDSLLNALRAAGEDELLDALADCAVLKKEDRAEVFFVLNRELDQTLLDQIVDRLQIIAKENNLEVSPGNQELFTVLTPSTVADIPAGAISTKDFYTFGSTPAQPATTPAVGTERSFTATASSEETRTVSPEQPIIDAARRQAETIARLQAELETRERKIQTLKANAATLQDELTAAQNRIRVLENQPQESAELNTLRNTNAALEDTLVDLRSELEENEKTLQEYITANQDTYLAIKEMASVFSDLVRALDAVDLTHPNAKESLAKVTNQIQAVADTLTTFTQENNDKEKQSA